MNEDEWTVSDPNEIREIWRPEPIVSNIGQEAEQESRRLGIDPHRHHHSEFDNNATRYMDWAIRRMMTIEEKTTAILNQMVSLSCRQEAILTLLKERKDIFGESV